MAEEATKPAAPGGWLQPFSSAIQSTHEKLERNQASTWRLGLNYFLEQPWLDDVVLVPATDAPNAFREEQKGLWILQAAGAFVDDPGVSP